MIKLYDEGVYLVNGDAIVKESESEIVGITMRDKKTMSYMQE